MAERTLAFRLRGLDGCVRVRYVLNDDPRRWGYDRLELDFEIDTARGFPVIEGRVEYPAEGYAGYLTLCSASQDDWLDVREGLRSQLPSWTFGGDAWQPPPLE